MQIGISHNKLTASSKKKPERTIKTVAPKVHVMLTN